MSKNCLKLNTRTVEKICFEAFRVLSEGNVNGNWGFF